MHWAVENSVARALLSELAVDSWCFLGYSPCFVIVVFFGPCYRNNELCSRKFSWMFCGILFKYLFFVVVV